MAPLIESRRTRLIDVQRGSREFSFQLNVVGQRRRLSLCSDESPVQALSLEQINYHCLAAVKAVLSLSDSASCFKVTLLE